MALTEIQIQQFIYNGFIKLDNAFPSEIAEEGRNLLWKASGCKPDDPSSWTQPVIRLGDFAQEPFIKAANTPLLHTAFNQLVGEGKWLARKSLGTFPIRFPSKEIPNDTGWHVDASFAGDEPTDYFSWKINIHSKGRALLMLFLFSDVEENDAPTQIRVGSHLDVAKLLESAGESGLSFLELAQKLEITAQKEVISATGTAGTVYLCHPFLVHAAQAHRGENPRFLAQPPLFPVKEFEINRLDGQYSPVELAIRIGIGLDKII